jgi:RNA polymerase sigma-70 factor (ECF subfamily)
MMSEQPKTRASLILRLRSPEDAAAWQEFVDIYQPLVYRLARARGLQDADAFDTTQEVLTRVAGAINRWDPDPERGSFRGWISRITRNLVIELMRSKNRLPKTSDDSSIQQIIQQTPGRSEESDLFDIEHERQVFAWASQKIEPHFEPRTWLAFWKSAVEHQPIADVATELEISTGAVYIARSRVMARLKQTVERYVSSESETQSLPTPKLPDLIEGAES